MNTLARPFLDKPLVHFALKAAAFYGAWFVLYDLWLLPDGRLDHWLSIRVSALSADGLHLLGLAATQADRAVHLPGAPGVFVADGCNGLAAFGLFAGFVVAYPGPWRHRAWFLAAGVGTLFAVNVIRVAGILLVQLYAPHSFDWVHSFLSTGIFYVVSFGLWMAWVRLADTRALVPH